MARRCGVHVFFVERMNGPFVASWVPQGALFFPLLCGGLCFGLPTDTLLVCIKLRPWLSVRKWKYSVDCGCIALIGLIFDVYWAVFGWRYSPT